MAESRELHIKLQVDKERLEALEAAINKVREQADDLIDAVLAAKNTMVYMQDAFVINRSEN